MLPSHKTHGHGSTGWGEDLGSGRGMIVVGARVISAKGIAEFMTSFDVAEMQNTHEITAGKGRVVGRKAVR